MPAISFPRFPLTLQQQTDLDDVVDANGLNTSNLPRTLTMCSGCRIRNAPLATVARPAQPTDIDIRTSSLTHGHSGYPFAPNCDFGVDNLQTIVCPHLTDLDPSLCKSSSLGIATHESKNFRNCNLASHARTYNMYTQTLTTRLQKNLRPHCGYVWAAISYRAPSAHNALRLHTRVWGKKAHVETASAATAFPIGAPCLATTRP